MVSKDEWADLAVSLRTAIACGTLGNCQALGPDDPERNRIHEAAKQQVSLELGAWISAGDCKGD